MCTGQRLELANQLLVAADGEIDIDALLDRRYASLFKARDLGLSECVEGEICEGGPAPERQSFEQRPSGLLRISLAKRAPAVFHEPLESIAVEVVGRDAEHVPGTACEEDLFCIAALVQAAERLSKLRDVDLCGLHGGRRWMTLPQLVDQPIDRDDLVSVKQQDGQERPLLDATQVNLASLRPDLDRTEDSKLHVRRQRKPMPAPREWP